MPGCGPPLGNKPERSYLTVIRTSQSAAVECTAPGIPTPDSRSVNRRWICRRVDAHPVDDEFVGERASGLAVIAG